MQPLSAESSRVSIRTSRKRDALHRMILPAICASSIALVFADWTNAKDLREQLGELVAEAEAIAQVAKSENRDLAADEVKRVDQILGRGEPGQDSYVPGLVHDLQQKIERAEKIAGARAQIMQSMGGNHPAPARVPASTSQQSDDAENGGIIARVRVPANVIRPKLNAVKCYGSQEQNYRAAYAIGRFGLAVLAKDPASIQWCEDHGLIKGGLTGGVPADGGYLVPSELSSAIIYVRDMYGVFRREADVEPMMSDTKDCAVQTSGLPYFFTAEAVALTEGQPVFSNVALVAKKVGCIARFSSELGEDAITEIGDNLVRDLGEAIAKAEDDCGFIGDGTGTYGSMTGLVNALAGLKGLLVTGTTANFANVSNAHFRSMIAAVPGKYRMGAKWFCNATVFDAAMGPVLDAAGGNNYMDMANGESQTMFKGYPVVFVPSMIEAEDCVATSKPIIFGNVRAAAKLGDRRQVRIAQSEHRYFETDEIAVKGTSRFHAKVHAVGTAGQTGAYTVMQVS